MTRPEQSVIDDIDALVDEQLQQTRTGYDYNVGEERCRCGRDWHGLPSGGCPGSCVEGPVAENPQRIGVVDMHLDLSFRGIEERIRTSMNALAELFASSAEEMCASMRGFAASVAIPNDLEPETPQQRALPRPSTTPPMWADNPGRTRRTTFKSTRRVK